MRVSVCSWATTEEDISKSINSFEKALALEWTKEESAMPERLKSHQTDRIIGK